MIQATNEFNTRSKYIHIDLESYTSYAIAFNKAISDDLKLVQLAILLVGTYTILNIGGFSPIHCRCCVSICGLICIGICFFAGFGIAFTIGLKESAVHGLMAFLLIGIGVDDMFVIANAID